MCLFALSRMVCSIRSVCGNYSISMHNEAYDFHLYTDTNIYSHDESVLCVCVCVYSVNG